MPTLKSKSDSLILYTLGDPAGIGAEILIKALAKNKKFLSVFNVVIADRNVLEKMSAILNLSLKFNFISDFNIKDLKRKTLNIIDLRNRGNVKFGHPSKYTGKIALEYLKKAVQILKKYPSNVDALITLPVSKQYIEMNGIKFKGHTEYFKTEFNSPDVLMIFLTPRFDLLLFTRHLALKDVARNIKKEKLIRAVYITVEFYRKVLGIDPKIAVLGLNPHAGEGGTIGKEEREIIVPAIKKLRKKAVKIEGPFPADGFFINLDSLDYRIIVSMYHDQTLPLIKAFYPEAVNFSLGLPFLRFSPDHGTAFDIAGSGVASSSSLEKAIEYALKFKCR